MRKSRSQLCATGRLLPGTLCRNVADSQCSDFANSQSCENQTRAEKVLEIIIKTMARKYGRGAEYEYVLDFELPWIEHFPRFKTA